MNLTVLSLSLSSLYSLSPIFVGNRNVIQHSTFKFYFSPVFYNLDNLLLENCAFSNANGPVLYSGSDNEIYETHSEQTFKDIENYILDTSSNFDYKCYILRQSTFIRIHATSHDFIIMLKDTMTSYVTECSFTDCYSKKTVLWFASKSATFTHICAYKNDRYHNNPSNPNDEQEVESLFLYADTPINSFCKMVYSSFYEDYKYINATM